MNRPEGSSIEEVLLRGQIGGSNGCHSHDGRRRSPLPTTNKTNEPIVAMTIASTNAWRSARLDRGSRTIIGSSGGVQAGGLSPN